MERNQRRSHLRRTQLDIVRDLREAPTTWSDAGHDACARCRRSRARARTLSRSRSEALSR